MATRCAGTVRASPRCTSFSVPIGIPSSSGSGKNRRTKTDNFRSLDAKCCAIVSVWIRTNQCQDLLKYESRMEKQPIFAIRRIWQIYCFRSPLSSWPGWPKQETRKMAQHLPEPVDPAAFANLEPDFI